MGLALYPGSLRNQADSIISNLQEDNRSLLCVLDGISQFTGNEDLKSVAWTSMKNQLNNHQAVIQGLICGNEAVIQGNETLKGAIGDEDLIEDELNDKIESLQAVNRQLNSSINMLEGCMRNQTLSMYSLYYCSMISSYQGCISANAIEIADLQEKLDKLYRIEAETSSLFAGANSLYNAVEKGIGAIGKGWNGVDGKFNALTINDDWRVSISTAWDKREEKEIQEIQRKIDEDYNVGKIDYDVYTSIKSGLFSNGMAFVRECLVSKINEFGADAIAEGVYTWIKNNTTMLMDRGMVAELAGGGEFLISETPSWISQVVRGGAKYAVPIIGTVIDFGIQKIQGEDNVDAGVKALTHTAIGLGAASVGAKAGAFIGTALGPVGTVVGAGVGFVLGVAGSMAFDYVYDNKEKIFDTAVNAAEGIGGAIGEFFGGIGDVIFG